MIIKSFAVKRIVVIAFALVLLLSPVACSRVDLSDKLKTDPMGYTPKQIKEEIMPQVAETVVEALEKDDEDKLKSVFSKSALADTTDWDLGCEYMFDLYEGTHTDIRDYNYSQYETYKMDESINEISCICYIETGDKVYRLDWVDVLENEADADSVGVYNLCIREWEEGYGKEGGVFPGIDYPERFSGSYITTAIETVGDYANSSLDMPLLYVSDKLLGNMSEDEKTDLAKALLAINNKNIKKRWCEPSNEGEQASFFIDADISSVGKCVLSFICDTEVRNEITAVKVTMYDGDIPASSELVAEEYKAEGINEFVQKCIAGGVDFSQYPETMEEAFADDNKTIPEIEYEGKTLNLIPEIQNPGTSEGEVLGRVEIEDKTYPVTKLKSDYGCDVYLINYSVYAESKDVDGLVDYYMNKADITFTYYEYKKSGSDEHEIDFSMEMYSQLRGYNDEGHEMQVFKLDAPAHSFEIRVSSTDGVYDGHISVMEYEDNMVLGAKTVPYVAGKGYFLSDEEIKYIQSHIK